MSCRVSNIGSASGGEATLLYNWSGSSSSNVTIEKTDFINLIKEYQTIYLAQYSVDTSQSNSETLAMNVQAEVDDVIETITLAESLMTATNAKSINFALPTKGYPSVRTYMRYNKSATLDRVTLTGSANSGTMTYDNRLYGIK